MRKRCSYVSYCGNGRGKWLGFDSPFQWYSVPLVSLWSPVSRSGPYFDPRNPVKDSTRKTLLFSVDTVPEGKINPYRNRWISTERGGWGRVDEDKKRDLPRTTDITIGTVYCPSSLHVLICQEEVGTDSRMYWRIREPYSSCRTVFVLHSLFLRFFPMSSLRDQWNSERWLKVVDPKKNWKKDGSDGTEVSVSIEIRSLSLILLDVRTSSSFLTVLIGVYSCSILSLLFPKRNEVSW